MGGITPKIRYENLVYVSLRDYEVQEEYLIRQNKVKVFSTEEINNLGIDFVANFLKGHYSPLTIGVAG